MTVVTRFAPSPTGDLHIGSARTALFAYLYAKHCGGKFLLRIEDTDKDRHSDEAVKVIYDGLKWLGLEYDGEAVFQSARADHHKEVVNEMLANGSAYRCYMTPEEVAATKKLGTSFRSTWRDKTKPVEMGANAPWSDLFVVRFKGPTSGETVVHDLVKGDAVFKNENLDDMVLLRSDGTPTYNLAVVVDDHDMGVNTVIRGDDHLNNTPKQILIYEAMGWDVPKFAHIPLIHGEDGKKLGKRVGSSSIMDFADMGYLPEAMCNYLTHLGWGHGDDEIFSMEDAIKWFDIADVVKSPARINFKKLNNINHHYIGVADDVRLTELMGYGSNPEVARVVGILKDGAKTINELCAICGFAIHATPNVEVKAVELLASDKSRAFLKDIAKVIRTTTFTIEDLNFKIHRYVDIVEVPMKVAGPLIRAALTGKTVAPDLGTCVYALGYHEALRRLENPFEKALDTATL